MLKFIKGLMFCAVTGLFVNSLQAAETVVPVGLPKVCYRVYTYDSWSDEACNGADALSVYMWRPINQISVYLKDSATDTLLSGICYQARTDYYADTWTGVVCDGVEAGPTGTDPVNAVKIKATGIVGDYQLTYEIQDASDTFPQWMGEVSEDTATDRARFITGLRVYLK